MWGGEEAGALLNKADMRGLIGKVGFEQRLETPPPTPPRQKNAWSVPRGLQNQCDRRGEERREHGGGQEEMGLEL